MPLYGHKKAEDCCQISCRDPTEYLNLASIHLTLSPTFSLYTVAFRIFNSNHIEGGGKFSHVTQKIAESVLTIITLL